MPTEDERLDSAPHEPRKPTRIDAEGFGSPDGERDIFFAAVKSTRMPMVVADPRLPDVPIVFVNEAFLEMTGYSHAEVLGRNCRFLQGPDTDRDTVARIGQAVREEREVTVELLNYRKDGSSFWNALFMTPVRKPDGELVYFFSSQLDISRRHDAESALMRSQKLEALGQLTGGIAHDFNNLLQIIQGNIDVASLLTRNDDNPKLAKVLRNVLEALRKSGALTQQLLAFARKQQLQGRVINLNEQLDRFGGLARQVLGEKIRCTVDAGASLWNARIDPTQAEAALLNLLRNAKDAMPEGGTATLRTANLEVDDRGAAEHGLPLAGRYVLLSVADTGCGIPADALPRVMDPFFTTKPMGEGSGLGLSMVYGFAKQSGGVADIESEPGVGTTVRLYFPATVDHVSAQRLYSGPRRDKGRERILIVDDRAEIAELAGMILGEAGYECVECVSADQALEVLERSPPFSLLLTDLIMPGGMNGVLLAREAQRRQPELQVLLMTGFADGTPDRWGGEHFEIILKPFNAEDLKRKTRLALDGATGKR